jgi:hypothetical protein
MQPRCVNGGVHRYSMTVFPVTVQRLQAMVGPRPVVEDADTRQLPEPTSVERARLRAWLWRFVRRGDAVRWPPIPSIASCNGTRAAAAAAATTALSSDEKTLVQLLDGKA